MAFPKVKIGKQTNKVSRFDMSHDVNTTSDFGYVSPLTCFEMIGKSKLTVDAKVLCRLAPLPLPTFGRVSLRVFHRFIPTADIYEAYENLLSAQNYTGGSRSYVPTEVPQLTLRQIFALVTKGSFCTIYKLVGNNKYEDLGANESGATFHEFEKQLCQCIVPGTSASTYHYDYSGMSPMLPKMKKSPYVGYVDPRSADFIYNFTIGSTHYKACIKLNDPSKHLRKVFVGLGYPVTIGMPNKVVSMLPLMAYYKGYFDIFDPQRNKTWTDTNMYKFMEYVRTNDWKNCSNNVSASNFPTLIKSFVEDIKDFYYTDNQDVISAHIASPSLAPNEDLTFSDPNSLATLTFSPVQNRQPVMDDTGTGTETLSSLEIATMRALTLFRNIETNIKGRISEYMRVFRGNDILHNKESNHIGSFVVPCIISDVMNSAQTETGGEVNYLGDYAGKGIGFKDNQKFTFEAPTDGYWIVYIAVVPSANYFQGVAPHLTHISRFEMYNPQFDALGYDLTTKSAVSADCPYRQDSEQDEDDAFGFIPRYTSFKYHNNVVNSDLSLPSLRPQYLGYSLDKYLTPVENLCEHFDNSEDNGLSFISSYMQYPQIPIASEAWRYINKYPWLGNYDRIFYNNNVEMSNADRSRLITEDNFFINAVIDAKYFAPMLPLSESFDTDGDDARTVDVVKA